MCKVQKKSGLLLFNRRKPAKVEKNVCSHSRPATQHGKSFNKPWKAQHIWFRSARSWPTLGLFGPLHQNNHRALTLLWQTLTVWNHFLTPTWMVNLRARRCHEHFLIIVWIMWVLEEEMFLTEGEMLFWGQESMSVLHAAVVVSLQDRDVYLEVRDWEEIRQWNLHFA